MTVKAKGASDLARYSRKADQVLAVRIDKDDGPLRAGDVCIRRDDEQVWTQLSGEEFAAEFEPVPAEAETASLRAQLAEARAERDEERKARLRDESEHLGVRHELAEAMAAAPRWVPVGERLPSEQVMVLLHSPHSQRSSVQYGFYGSDGRGRRTEWFVQTTLGWEPVTDTGDPVTHWQPLPAPPQEERA